MKIKHNFLPNPLTISDAIQHKLEDIHYDTSGFIEDTRNQLNNHKELLGELVELLHTKLLLTNEEILSLLGHGYEEVDRE